MPVFSALRRRLSWILGACGLLVLLIAGSVLTFRIRCAPSDPVPDTSAADAAAAGYWKEWARAEDNSALTLPEWQIVYSAQENGRFVAERGPGTFPYWGSVAQYWQTYCAAYRETKGRYPPNGGYHLMLNVIGVSFTLENGLIGLYEHTVGWFSEMIGGTDTPEDEFAARVAAVYGDFLPTTPWYDFPFAEKIGKLWALPGWWGPSPVRRWERRLWLTAQWGVKAGYGWAMRAATNAAYDAPPTEVAVLVRTPPSTLLTTPRVRKIQDVKPDAILIAVPHYAAFTEVMLPLLRSGLQVERIAGNDEIVMTVLAPRGWVYPGGDAQPILAYDLKSEPRERVALRVPVASLPAVVRAVEASGGEVEHLYDY